MTAPRKPPISDPPPTGRPGDIRVRRTHPDVAAFKDADQLTLRLRSILAANPGLVKFRADELSNLDLDTKTLLLAQLDQALGLDLPTPTVIHTDG